MPVRGRVGAVLVNKLQSGDWHGDHRAGSGLANGVPVDLMHLRMYYAVLQFEDMLREWGRRMKKTACKLLRCPGPIDAAICAGDCAEDANVTVRAIDSSGGRKAPLCCCKAEEGITSPSWRPAICRASDCRRPDRLLRRPSDSHAGLSALEHTQVGDTTYYALEQLMNEFQVQIVRNGDGNSLSILYRKTTKSSSPNRSGDEHRLLSADLFGGQGFSANFISAFSFVYETVIHLRFNAIWAGRTGRHKKPDADADTAPRGLRPPFSRPRTG